MAYKPRRLDWSMDPARGGANSGRPADAKGAYDFNRRLYSPGSELMDSVINPPAPPTPRMAPSGWQKTSFDDLEGILSRYAPGRGSRSIPGAAGIAQPLQPRPLTLGASESTMGYGDAVTQGITGAPSTSTSGTVTPAIGVTNGGMQGPPAPDSAMVGYKSRSLFEREKADWMERGGTQRTLNRALRAQGIRPAIGGRATSSPRNAPTEFARRGIDRVVSSPEYLPY